MSANRSVQAAQRRRAGPSNGEPAIPGRGPQPSINSAQMFANQARPGQGPSMPTGRLAGQQHQMQQQQMQQAQNQHNMEKLANISKMTIPQAITLITLRLGALESKMMNSNKGFGDEYDCDSGIDPSFLQDIVTRIDSIEKQLSILSTPNQLSNSSSNSNSNSEINLLKQQFETIKQNVIQTKSASVSLIKENTSLKTQIENLKKELAENKELISSLQDMTIDNSKKILNLSMNTSIDYNTTTLEDLEDGLETTDLSDLPNDTTDDEIVGTDLKQLIENELKADS